MAAGLSLNGFGGAGGMGKMLAEWIVEGEPSLDLFAFHGWRFGRSYADPFYAAERTREGVKYYYYLRFPNDENEWARPAPRQPGPLPTAGDGRRLRREERLGAGQLLPARL